MPYTDNNSVDPSFNQQTGHQPMPASQTPDPTPVVSNPPLYRSSGSAFGESAFASSVAKAAENPYEYHPSKLKPPETVRHVEAIPIPTPQPAALEKKAETPPPIPKSSSTPKTPSVVDETKEALHLHPVDKNADTLTSIADQDETKFIEEVKHAHEHK